MDSEKEASSRWRSSLSPPAILGLVVVGLTLVHKMSKKHNKKVQGQTDSHNNPPESCRYEPRSVYPVRIEPTAEDNQWQCKQKQYWERQLNLARWLNWITAVAGFAAVIYAGITLFQLYLTKQQFRVQQRPWIGVPQAATNYVAFEPGNNLTVHGIARIKNFGQSPALLVYPGVIPTASMESLDESMRSTCKTAKDAMERSPESGILPKQPIEGTTIFPGQEVDWPFVTADTALPQMPQSPLLAGCFYYRDQWGKERHTQFCYFLHYTTTNEQLRVCPWDNAAY